MKKIIIITRIILIFLIIFVFFSSSNIKIKAEDNSPIISFTYERISDNEIEVVTKLVKNSGILAMKLDLVYDTDVMTLKSFTYGEALNSLNPLSTNVSTEKGYGIYPFMFSYEGYENDTSTGILVNMIFQIKDNCKTGNYTIGFDYEKNKDITALSSNKIITKNLLIDKITISIKTNNIIEITVNKYDEGKKSNLIMILCISIGSLIIITISIFIIIKNKNKIKEKWIKL